MPKSRPNVRLQVLNSPENVVLVRGMLSGVAEALALGETDVNDIRTAVTEACNNVVLHAYAGEVGPMEVEVELAEASIEVTVRDRGAGMARPLERAREGPAEREGPGEREGDGGAIENELPSGGIGLHVIETLAHEVAYGQPEGGGAEVRMWFALPTGALGGHAESVGAAAPAEPCPGPSSAHFSVAPLTLARTTLPRMAVLLAARAHFSTDRLSDVQLLADALAAHTEGALQGERLEVEIDAGGRTLDLRIGPLRAGSAERLLADTALDGVGSVVEKIADSHAVATRDSHETLALGLRDRR